jgi:hypothetical protein
MADTDAPDARGRSRCGVWGAVGQARRSRHALVQCKRCASNPSENFTFCKIEAISEKIPP